MVPQHAVTKLMFFYLETYVTCYIVHYTGHLIFFFEGFAKANKAIGQTDTPTGHLFFFFTLEAHGGHFTFHCTGSRVAFESF